MTPRLRTVLLCAMVATLASLLLAGNAFACSCAGPAPGEERSFYREALKRSDGAIVGKLLRKRPVGQAEYPRKAIYVYRVTRAFKAEGRLAARKVRVRSPFDGASCGIEQPIGTRGGLFLYRQKGTWTSYLCSQVSPRDLRRAARGGSGESRAASSPRCAVAAAAA